MKGKSVPTVPESLKYLFDGFSTQNKSATRYWIALAVISALVILQRSNCGTVTVQFLSASVALADFYPFAFALISLLLIAYGSTNAQLLRTKKLVMRSISPMKDKYLDLGHINVQDVFDAVTTPSIGRVAPLAQILQIRTQFRPESSRRSWPIAILAATYFVFLRVAGVLVIEGIPSYALWTAYQKGGISYGSSMPLSIPIWLFWFIGLIGVAAIVEIIVLDILYAVDSVRHILRSQKNKM